MPNFIEIGPVVWISKEIQTIADPHGTHIDFYILAVISDIVRVSEQKSGSLKCSARFSDERTLHK
jgi:hypothetical protein